MRNSVVEWRIINHQCPNINNSLLRMGFSTIPRKNAFQSRACVWSKFYPDDVICALNMALKLRRCHKKLWHQFESLMLGVCQFTLIACSRPWDGFTRWGQCIALKKIPNNWDMRYECGVLCEFLILCRIIKFCKWKIWIAEKKNYDADANVVYSWNLNWQKLSMNCSTF